MRYKMTKFRIAQLRQQKIAVSLEVIAILFFATFVSLFLPQLLFQYIYSGQHLTEPPALLQYIPLAAFVVGALYFVYAVIGNVTRSMTIAKLEKEMMMMTEDDMCCAGCSGDCKCDEHGNCQCGACDTDTSMTSMDSVKKKRNK